MPSDDFPNAPDVGRHFFNNRLTPEPDWEKRKAGSDQGDPSQDVDHLEPTLDYTPGGRLEQDVHTELSDNARRQLKQQAQRSGPSNERQYFNRVQQRFDHQLEQAKKEQDEKLRQEERDAKLLKLFDEKQKEAQAKAEQDARATGDSKEPPNRDPSDRKASSYDMPDQEGHDETRDQPAPTENARVRQGRSERGGPDRSGGGHER